MIIFGTRGLTSTVQSGAFYCPRCGPNRTYWLRRIRRWFTLYFIPVIPLDVAGEYVECQQCAGTFGPDALTYDPVREQQQTHEDCKRVLILVALEAGGPPTEQCIKSLREALLDLTGIHFAPEELWQEFHLAQTAQAKFLPFACRLAPRLTDHGKSMLLGAAYTTLAGAGRLSAADPILGQLGTVLGLSQSMQELVLQKLKSLS